ncbi:TonB system transport protein ExbD [Suttonella ornithocola]|uniref:Biopolymer transport protein ExbD n=1 Tax=Suttonella ornithocola TaxID=279832 RepID=A0A380MN64_9GAMM|nr:TonB system transport protein ExbD [Suttonella ornithocola]SUO93181.1 Biopolymer transport protein exbD [Suttonella ornithocola]
MKKFDQINVIPFIDIMLVLLAIVLLTASFAHNGKIDVTLPSADNADPVETETLPKVITVNADSQYYLDDQALTLEALATAIQHWEKNQPILLKLDKNTPFENFVTLTERLKAYQLTNISVLTTTPQ